MFTKVVKCKPDIMPLNVFWSILWNEAVSREMNMKLLLETVACIAIKERVTCIITIKITIKTVTCITATERSTNITVTESTTSKPA